MSNYIELAEKHGAKFYHSEGDPVLFTVLDQQDNFLYDAYFRTKEAAAKAYCLVHRLNELTK